jgi:hypothetical protein
MPSFSTAGSPPLPAAAFSRPSSTKPIPQPILPSQPPLAQPPPPITPQSTGNYKKPTLKARRDALNAQLPLKAGRQIAVKEAKKGTPVIPGVPDNYILGRIVSCIQGDKNRFVILRPLSPSLPRADSLYLCRYCVEDVDYDPTNPTADGGCAVSLFPPPCLAHPPSSRQKMEHHHEIHYPPPTTGRPFDLPRLRLCANELRPRLLPRNNFLLQGDRRGGSVLASTRSWQGSYTLS